MSKIFHIPIFDFENWKEIGATLSRNKTRTFLTGFGIFWGVAMLAVLMGGARGGIDMLMRNFAGFATNSAAFIASKTTMPYKGTPKDKRWYFDLTDIELIRQTVPELQAVLPIYQSWGNASLRNGRFSYAGSALGVRPEYVMMSKPKIYSGRFINEADVSQQRKVVCIGRKIANEIFPAYPDPVGKSVQVNAVNYTVIGVIGQLNDATIGSNLDETVVLPESTFRRAFARGDEVDFVMAVSSPEYKMSDLVPRVRSTVYRHHQINPADENAMWVMDISREFEQAGSLLTGVNILAWFIGFSTLLAGIIGIGNIMWVIVKERTQEIGIRRAIGAKPRDIIVQVLCEGMALTVIAGLAGICFAALILGVAYHITNEGDPAVIARFQMSFSSAMGIVGIFIVLGTLAGLVPSIKAMKIKPIEALNDK